MDIMQALITFPGEINKLYFDQIVDYIINYIIFLIKYYINFLNFNTYTFIEFLGGLIFNLIKLLTFSLILLFISMFFYRMVKDTGFAILPFEISNIGENEFSGKSISDMLTSDLNKIKQIQEFDFNSIGLLNTEKIFLPSIGPITETLDYNMAEMGEVGVGESKISLGRLLITLKMLFGRPGKIITGSLGKYDNQLRIVAYLGGTEKRYWDVSCILDKNDVPGGKIPELVADLAYKISCEFKNNGANSAKTWKALKHFTEALNEIIQYSKINKIEILNNAVLKCLEALSCEPGYEKPLDLLSIIGFEYIKNNDYKNAIYVFNNITKSRPEIKELGMGLMYLESKHYKEAGDCFEKVIELDPSIIEATFGIFEVFSRMGDETSAAEAMFKMLDLQKPSHATWYNKKIAQRILSYTSISFKDSTYDEKAKLFIIVIIILFCDKAISLDPENVDAFIQRGIFLGALKKDDPNFDKIRVINSSLRKGNIFSQKIEAILPSLKKDDPITYLNKAIDLSPKCSEAWLQRGKILAEQEGRQNEAFESFEKVIKLNERLIIDLGEQRTNYEEKRNLKAAALYQKGSLLATLNRDEEAVEAYKEAIDTFDCTEAYEGLISSLTRLGRSEEAGMAKTQSALAWYSKGLALADKNKAIECFNNAIQRDPNLAYAYLEKGLALASQNRHVEAIAVYEKIIDRSKSIEKPIFLIDSLPYYLALIDKGASLKALIKPDDALRSYEEAIKLDPDRFMAYFQKGVLLADLNRDEEAVEAYKEASKRINTKITDPQYAKLHEGLNSSLTKLGRKEEAA